MLWGRNPHHGLSAGFYNQNAETLTSKKPSLCPIGDTDSGNQYTRGMHGCTNYELI